MQSRAWHPQDKLAFVREVQKDEAWAAKRRVSANKEAHSRSQRRGSVEERADVAWQLRDLNIQMSGTIMALK